MKNALALLLVLTSTSLLFAQKQPSKKSVQRQLVGTWTLIDVDNIYPNGSRVRPYGDNPVGLLMFDSAGNYTLQILKAVRPKVAAGDKNKCTPEENAALVQGSNSHFGKYTVDETGGTITFKIEHAFYTNWEGTEQKRTYTLTGNEIKYVVTNTTQGGEKVIAEVAWRKL